MKEIKFRMYSKVVHHMYYSEDNIEDPGLWNIKDFVDGGKLILENDEGILTQNTGLKDKNGKEIYAGDIIKSREFNGELSKIEVIYNKKECAFTTKEGYLFARYENEVIGNKFEDPELLEEK